MAVRRIEIPFTVETILPSSDGVDEHATMVAYQESLEAALLAGFPDSEVRVANEFGDSYIDADTEDEADMVNQFVQDHYARGGFFVLADGTRQ